MILENLQIIQYKNIAEKSLHFSKKINCFVGDNGQGKTNILDAIYNLAYGKSYFNPIALQNIQHEKDFFMIEGQFLKGEKTEHIICSVKKGQKKLLKRNGKTYEKFSEHIGLIPLVIISPSDQDLIYEGSDVRRKFMDTVIAHHDAIYLQQLIDYQKIISQRNALLKYFAVNQIFDEDSLAVYNEMLIPLAHAIFDKRTQFINKFNPIFQEFHKKITNNNEQVDLIYESQLSDSDMSQLLKNHLTKDKILQYTSVGTHKDDLQFTIDNHPIKKYGSQGQQKSLLIALKLAQFEFLKKESGILPILLFDDIFDKLDAHRVQKIIDLVNDKRFGQLFITDTHADRTEKIVQSTQMDYEIIPIP